MWYRAPRMNSYAAIHERLLTLNDLLQQQGMTLDKAQTLSGEYFEDFRMFFQLVAKDIVAAGPQQRNELLKLIVNTNNLYIFPSTFNIDLPDDLDEIAYDFDHDEYPGNELRINKILNQEYLLLEKARRAQKARYRCKRCRGTGQVPGVKKVLNMGRGMGSDYGTCPDCDGNGWVDKDVINPKPNSLQ
jgi:hypothetical protein